MSNHKQNFLRHKRDNRQWAKNLGGALLIFIKALPYFIISIILIGIIGILVAGLSLLPQYNSLKDGYRLAKEGQANLLAAESSLKEQKFSEANQEFLNARENFQSAKVELQQVSGSFVFKVAAFHDQLVVAENIIDIGATTSEVLSDVSKLGQEFLDNLKTSKLSFTDISEEKKAQLLATLTASEPKLEASQKKFEELNKKLEETDKLKPLFVFNVALDPLKENLPRLKKAFDGLVVGAKLLPAFSGYPEEKTYLLIFQNNREMRPSGGFIGTYGVLKIKNAEIKTLVTDNIYNLDRLSEPYLNIPSPEPMKKYLNQPKWFMRDANWWPDFPTSMQKVLWFYEQEKGTEKFDGVIAITPTVIENLLGMLGEFNVDGIKFNKDNFWEQLEYQVEFGYSKKGIDDADRKDIISDLSKQMMDRLHNLPLEQLTDVVDVMSKSVAEKQMNLYFRDAQIQKIAIDNNWAGEVKQTNGDYLMLVDANLAALKTDEVMKRSLNYKLVQGKNGEVLAETKVRYENKGNFDWKTTRYRSYTRLYVPIGSSLKSIKVAGKELARKDVDVVNEFNKTSFGFFFEVEPKKYKDIVITYSLPKAITEQIAVGSYTLLIQKQAGIPQMNLLLDLNFNREIQGRDKINFTSSPKSLKHSQELRKDEFFTVWLK